MRGREKADVAVVGGGLSGVTTALWLSRAGLRVAIAEAETIGYGASGCSGGILAPSRSMQYVKMAEDRGDLAAEACVQTRLKAMRAICELHSKYGMRFQLQENRAFLIAVTSAEAQRLGEEAEAVKRAGLSAEVVMDSNCPFHAEGMLKLSPAYTLHPLEYLRALAVQAETLGVRIFERSRVTAVETDVVYTDTGSIQAPYIVVSTGYPVVNTPGWYFLRLEQRREKLIRLTGVQAPQSVFFAADGSFAYRPFEQGALLMVTGRYVGSAKLDEEDQAEKDHVRKLGLTQAGEVCSGVEAYTPDGLPYIGAYSAKTPNLFVATGYGGDGLMGSMIAAQAISAQILGLPSEGYGIYSPKRRLNGLSVPLHLGGRYMRGLFGGAETPRCSHMGCRLKFNSSTRLWECPCHGSRFDDIGRVVNAPAVHAAQLRGRK